jgi:ferredoxin--NADP+ reductase
MSTPSTAGPAAEPVAAPAALPSHLFAEHVLTVHHWTDRLFSFTTTRNPGLRFQSGQFTMIGLMVNGKPLLRAYSMASPHYEETLEFLSIKVPDGPLTSRLQHLQPGDTVLVGRKPSGTLLVQNLRPNEGGPRKLFLLGTGTGLAPFMSVIRDPEVYEHFEQVILVHGCRLMSELAYRDDILTVLPANEYYGELVRAQLRYYPTVTREPVVPLDLHQGRLTTLIASGQLFHDLGYPAFDPAQDRFMLCGSPELLRDMKTWFDAQGLTEGNMSQPGDYVIERAFVEK